MATGRQRGEYCSCRTYSILSRMTRSGSNLITIGKAHARNGERAFGIREDDRFMHTYVIGQTGTGKSTLLLNMALQDAHNGTGFALIDSHGDLARSLSARLAETAVAWDIADSESPYGYNPLTRTSPALRPLIASALIDTLHKQWMDAWGVRMEHLLRHAILALLDTPRTDLRDILRLFLDDAFRKRVLGHVQDMQVRQFWTKEYPAMNYKRAVDGLAPIANKLGAFLSHPVVRTALCEPNTPLRFSTMMDAGQTLIVNLSKGRVGTDISNVLGGLLISGITHAAFTRHDVPQAQRRPFFLYVDEFHAFTTETLADLLSETRKYRLGVVLSQQHTRQSADSVLASIMGNVGTVICFRVGARDAPLLAAQLDHPEPRDLVTQQNYRAFTRMMIDGEPSRAFTMTTYPPLSHGVGD